MQYPEDTPFHRLLATRYSAEREQEAIDVLDEHPEIARLEWPGPDDEGKPFIQGSTALHYAANDGKLDLVRRLIEQGADVNASKACWYRSVLSWAANNARVDTVEYLLAHGARPDSFDSLHAAAWGGSRRGAGKEREYAATLRVLVAAGADKDDRRHFENRTPLAQALDSGNRGAIEYLRSVGASER